MIGRVINSVRTPFSPPSLRLAALACLGLAAWPGTGKVLAQQSGFQTDGTPIYQALPVPPNGVPPVMPVAPGQGSGPATAANPDYPQVVYPPIYSPEPVPSRPPRAMPVPEKKGKFGLFGKRKDKDRGETYAPAQRQVDSEIARVYPDPSTVPAQGQMQPRPGYDPNFAPGTAPTPADPYGRVVTPGTAPQPGMQPRPSLDSRYPVYTTQPAVPPASPGSGLVTSTLPPLPDSPTSMPSASQTAPVGGFVPPEPYPTSGASVAQAPTGPSMPGPEAPIFRREPVLEPAPAPSPSGPEPVLVPATGPGPSVTGSDAPIFRNPSSTPPAVNPPAPTAPPSNQVASTGATGTRWETTGADGTSPGQSRTGLAGSVGSLPAPKNDSPAPPKPESGEFANLPFAKPVPGKVGFVTLSTYGGEIDVRGIAPGTPVEIPDPSDSNKTIQFRVP
jgi:hypothetical protein